MADTIQESYDLKFETMFVDGDTRTFSLKNPKDEISTNEIEALNTFMQDSNIIIGDKYGGRFGKITSVKRIQKTTVNLDLSNDS